MPTVPTIRSGPELSLADAAALLAAHWGMAGELTDVGSYEDQNVRVAGDAGMYVLKITGSERSRAALQREHAALAHLAVKDIGYELPLPVGELVTTGGRHVRLLTWVAGVPLTEAPHLGDDTLVELGALTAAVAAGLADFAPQGADEECKWDPRLAPAILTDLLGAVAPEQRAVLTEAIAPLQALAPETSAALPSQLIHCDVTDYNVLWRPAADGRVRLTGLIDFGDLTRTWRVCDLACAGVAMAARDPDDPVGALSAVIRGYQRRLALSEAEAEALWPLVLARAAMCAATSVRHLSVSPDSAYLIEQNRGDWLALDALRELSGDLPTAAIRAVCGLDPAPRRGDVPRRLAAADPIPVIADLRPTTIDLGVDGDALGDGAWLEPRQVADAVHAARATIGRWGEVRLSASGLPSRQPPPTLHLGADVFAAAGTHVRAPLSAEVTSVRDREVVLTLRLDGAPIHVRLAGIEPVVPEGFNIARGGIIGHVAERDDGSAQRVHVQLVPATGQPGLALPRDRDAWLALCPDPSGLIGAPVAAPPPIDAARDLRRRESHVAAAQELYYERPMEIVRGWRQYLYDAAGRPYLDMINNVAVAGHSHPWIAAVAARQDRLLNTNSRFLYAAMSEYAERLTKLLGPELDTVFLVNSGSEACDLALQLARAFTGRRDVIVLAGAYHGATTATYEIGTSPADNPGWRHTVPEWVHVAEQPDPFRGRFGDDGAAYARSVAEQCVAARGNGGVAAFISEALLGSQGAVTPPAGYLAEAYRAVRAAGGVCIADEVQVGFGRTGESFWAFTHEDVVPDIVTLAKAAGNGHPVGAVVCRRDVAEALHRRGAFFSSPGGGTVSCRIGLAVLDVIEDEGLQDNARVIGGELGRDLRALAVRHPMIGAVHGRGLYQGVDLVEPGTGTTPAGGAARVVCERMRELGVIVAPTGDAANVLKVKPPLCITAADAAFFADVLDQALGEVQTVLNFR